MDNAVWAPLVLDLVLVLLVVGRAAGGWRTGLLTGGLGLLGTIGGAAVALWSWPRLVTWLPIGTLGDLGQILVLVLVVLAGATIGQALLGGLGRRLSSHGVEAIHLVDRTLGAIGAGVVAVLVLGLIAAAARPIVPASWAAVLDDSRAVRALDAVLPAPLKRAAADLTGVLEDAVFPRVFVDSSPEPVLPAEQPDGATTASAAVQAASASVIKVTATGCGGTSTGSGWVAAPQYVVTNAHVVAGGSNLLVRPEGSLRARPATLVAFDPDMDLAVLYAPGLEAPALPTVADVPDQSDVVVAGFPGGGPYVAEAGRVRGTVEAVGADIYGDPGVSREVYALRAELEQGNSGGPVLTPDGEVAGTVFAKSAEDTQTAYALTHDQTSALVDAAADRTEEVSSGACVSR